MGGGMGSPNMGSGMGGGFGGGMGGGNMGGMGGGMGNPMGGGMGGGDQSKKPSDKKPETSEKKDAGVQDLGPQGHQEMIHLPDHHKADVEHHVTDEGDWVCDDIPGMM
uniref:Uncharacterized protein n=1 Tax=Branchiostoma floridae TaxID=7739 RepID=C3Y270_BRAFL|eukprot:XP_002609950.1 hypothetical protein BRAFLDRAFT_85905 [Branchiostoma floridae]